MSWWKDTLAGAGRRIDDQALSLVYAAVSVRAEAVQRRLQRAGLAWVGQPGEPPAPWEIDRSADAVIGWTRANASLMGAVAGLAGWLSVPPEVAGWLVAVVRMAQRLGVVYGFDPETDRGRLAVARVLAEAFDVDLPADGVDGLKVSELFGLLPSGGRSAGSVPGELARAMLFRTTLRLAGRVGRLIPVVSAGFSLVDNQQRTGEVGARLKRAWQRVSERPLIGLIVDAVEVLGSGGG